MNTHDAARILEVSPDADEEIITKAYRAKARETHPDRGGTAEKFQVVEQAYRVLTHKVSEPEGFVGRFTWADMMRDAARDSAFRESAEYRDINDFVRNHNERVYEQSASAQRTLMEQATSVSTSPDGALVLQCDEVKLVIPLPPGITAQVEQFYDMVLQQRSNQRRPASDGPCNVCEGPDADPFRAVGPCPACGRVS